MRVSACLLLCRNAACYTLVVAESDVRLHIARILLLALGTDKGVAGSACSSTLWLNHGSLGCYRLWDRAYRSRTLGFPQALEIS